jgi:hypothetical protein
VRLDHLLSKRKGRTVRHGRQRKSRFPSGQRKRQDSSSLLNNTSVVSEAVRRTRTRLYLLCQGPVIKQKRFPSFPLFSTDPSGSDMWSWADGARPDVLGGGIAQLARAMALQAIGLGFESPYLHRFRRTEKKVTRRLPEG